MKLPKDLHAAAKCRLDYNENHDERGRFSVTAEGEKTGAGTEMHATLSAAKAQARTTSAMYGETKFHITEHHADGGKKVVAHAYQGKVTPPPTYKQQVNSTESKAAQARINAINSLPAHLQGIARLHESRGLTDLVDRMVAEKRIIGSTRTSKAEQTAKAKASATALQARTGYDKSIHTNSHGQDLITGPKFTTLKVGSEALGYGHIVVKEGGIQPQHSGGSIRTEEAAKQVADRMNVERNERIDRHMGVDAPGSSPITGRKK